MTRNQARKVEKEEWKQKDYLSFTRLSSSSDPQRKSFEGEQSSRQETTTGQEVLSIRVDGKSLVLLNFFLSRGSLTQSS
jgi:hypothetical protein